MTRQEEIYKAFEKALPATDGYTPFFCEKVAFKLGAEWADANPKSPWISVEDDLPCNHEDMIFEINPLDKSTNCVLVRFSYGGVSIESMHCRGYKQEWCWSADNITHWMIIPELHKE